MVHILALAVVMFSWFAVPGARAAQVTVSPGMFYTQTELDVLKALRNAPTHSRVWDNIRSWADAHINDAVPSYDGRNVHELVFRYLETMTFMYDMTDTPVYRDAGIRWMAGVSAWPDWRSSSGTNHWQSNSFIQFGMAIGYYGLRDELTAEDRSKVLDALTSADKGGYEVARYGGSLANPRFGHSYFPSGFPNHESTVGAATGISALAVGGDYPYSSNWLAFADAAIEYALSMGDSAGGWVEGPSYFDFSMVSLSLYLDISKRLSGEDYFSTYSSFLSNAATYAWYMNVDREGVPSKIQIEDATGNQGWATNGEPLWAYRLAREYNDGYAQEFGDTFAAQDYVAAFVWKDPGVPVGDHTKLPLARVFPDIGYVVARDSWDDSDATVLLFKSGRSIGHAHPNQNMFAIYKGGVALTGDLGYLGRYTEYQTSVLMNTVSLGTYVGNDGRLHGYGQAREPGDVGMATVPVGTSGVLSDFDATSIYIHVTGDASALYTGEVNEESLPWPVSSAGDARKVLRQFVWVQDLDYFVVYDGIDLRQPDQVNWNINALDLYNQVGGDRYPEFIYDAGSDTFIDSFASNRLEVRPIVPATGSASYYTGDYEGPSGREFSLLTISHTNGISPRLVTVLSPSDALSSAAVRTTAIESGNAIGVLVASAEYLDLVLFSRDGKPVRQYIELNGRYGPADGNSYAFSGTQVLVEFSGYAVMRLARTSGNRAPMLEPIGGKSAKDGSLLEFAVSATDPDDDLLTYSAFGLPPGAVFDTGTGVFSWTPRGDRSDAYSTVRFEVSDGTLVDSEEVLIFVDGNVPQMVNNSGNGRVDEAPAAIAGVKPEGASIWLWLVTVLISAAVSMSALFVQTQLAREGSGSALPPMLSEPDLQRDNRG